jgi:CMP-N-acetylneuraminic acid synthetase
LKTIAFIFARGGSKGMPGKNIRILGGKPLIVWSIEIAMEISEIDRVIVSTDDENIAAVGKEFGAEIINRPAELAQDDTPEWLAWQHAVKWLEDKGEYFDRFVSLPTTSPMRSKEDVMACLNLLDNQTDIVVTMTETTRSPFFNMVREENGIVKLLVDANKSYSRRQDTPKAFDMTTVAYVTRPKFIKQHQSVFDGMVKSVVIPEERAIDIDTKLDFEIAEMLINKRMGGYVK